jgi:cytochrome c oxidase subunit 1
MAVAGVHKPWFGATLKEWIFTTDHKKIGVMYGITSIIFFLIAGLSAVGIRLELFQPGLQYVDEDHYNQLLTLHGVVMVFWWAIGIWGSFGWNYSSRVFSMWMKTITISFLPFTEFSWCSGGR